MSLTTELMKKYYLEPLKTWVPSVTTVLKFTETEKSKKALLKWRVKQVKAVGEEVANQNQQKVLNTGTELHQAIADFLNNIPFKDPPPTPFFGNVLPFLKLLRSTSKLCVVEQFVSTTRYAGKFDLLTNYDGKVTILDWKSSQRFKRRSFLDTAFAQTAGYANAVDSLIEYPNVEQLAIVVISPKTIQVFTEERRKKPDQEWNRRLEEFHSLYFK